MHESKENVLLVSMPFAESSIPSIQIAGLESYLRNCGINASSLHLYLKAVDFYGLENYNLLINNPNDSYISQMVFSKHVFPVHFKENKDKFEDFFKNIISKNCDLFSFEEFVELTDKFLDFIYNKIDWKQFDLIGFTLNYGQTLPSLALSKKIKEDHPDIKIVIGGSTVLENLGRIFLGNFEWVDFVVSGEGEEALYKLAEGREYSIVPNLFYREKEEILQSKENSCIDMNNLSYPDFTSYYQVLTTCKPEVKQYFQLNGRLPIEFSRGCWWNKCSFCNLKVQHKNYREKDIKRFVDELSFLSDKYRMLSFQVIANTLPLKDYKELCKKIISLNKDFNLYTEARAGRLKRKDYSLLKKAGFNNIQTGIETFSSNYLKKIKKGVQLIDNIAALKFCRENNIRNHYNLIVNYPNEEKIDFDQTKENIQLFEDYLDPPDISYFIIVYGSEIYNNPEIFNIKKINHTKTNNLMFPENILDKNFSFYYDFERKENLSDNKWEELFSDWKKVYEKHNLDFIKNNRLIDKLVFYFVDGKSFLKIYDKRNTERVNIFVLDETERQIFLSCLDVVTFDELKEKFSDIPEHQIKEILNDLKENKIVFGEVERYLSLPLEYRLIEKPGLGIYKEQKKEEIINY